MNILIVRATAVGAIVSIAQNLEAAFWTVEGRSALAQRLLNALQGLLADEYFIVRDSAAKAIAEIARKQHSGQAKDVGC